MIKFILGVLFSTVLTFCYHLQANQPVAQEKILVHPMQDLLCDSPALRLFIAPQAPLVLVAALQMVCSADMEFLHQVGLPSKEDLGHLALAVEVPQVITMEALNLLEIPVMVREPMSSINFRAPQTITVFTAAAPQLEVILITLVADL